ncbi:glutamate ABC transporter substrate-binding protein [Mycolicibacterium sp. BiH015]|uniref:glutamate ABC transporter substrate-binding protein n=1 Tax=Mycolicibacterium sp. BiH015 TaxID=3018808 RepID=UPI0022E78691|nr:glutamate ABC transporter substrate-binding protein [Mycolicibacterium sp. BiH015]MDA2891162.1 glutamate ABC transporter substrate-binding protein [Mycolicibacterium sp. BiH015]
MTARNWAALCSAVLIASCSAVPPAPAPVTVTPVAISPAGVQEITAVPAPPAGEECNREASLRPGPHPAPGAMPTGSTMATIVDRGRLVVGVDQNTFPSGFRNPTTGQLEGFDVDLAREIARALFGDPSRVEFQVVNAKERETALTTGQVDLVIRTYSITCARKQLVDFSTVYLYAHQRILAAKGSGLDTPAELGGKRVCAVQGTTSLSTLFAMKPRPILIGATTWTDCLLLLQQGQVDAISTDDVVLAGLALQDPTVEIGGASLGVEPYGVGVSKDHPDLVRFVNGTLDRIRDDGTWQRLYDTWLSDLGPSGGPPAPKYRDG